LTRAASPVVMHNEFTFHLLNDAGKEKATKIALAFDRLLTELEEIVPGTSREMSLTRTHLEIASFFAKKAMASKPENGQSATP